MVTHRHGPADSAFAKEVLRSIRGSLARFLAIMGIVALGCGFFAGLQMSGIDMRLMADHYYDQTKLWDLRVISTLGFSSEGVAELSSSEGVEQAMGSRTVDAMAYLGNEQVAIRITSHATNALNQPTLVSGRWPNDASECVVSADAAGLVPEEGSVIEVLYGTDQLDDLLKTRRFTVVGTVSSPNYPYTGNFGSTTLGSGSIAQYLFVSDSAFAEDAPYTEVYLTVGGAREAASGSDEYEALVAKVRSNLDASEEARAQVRREELQDEAQTELNAKIEEYESSRVDAYGKLDSAKAELDDAAAQIADGQRRLEAGESDLRAGWSQYEQQKAEAERELAAAADQLGASQGQLDAQRSQWQTGADAVLAQTGASSLEAAAEQLAAQLAQVRATLAELQQVKDPDEKTAATIAALQQQEQELSQAVAQVSELQAAGSQIDGGQAQLDRGRQELASKRAEAEDALATAHQQLDDAQATLNSSRNELSDATARYNAGLLQWQDSKAEADMEFADAWSQIEEAQHKIDSIEPPDIYVLDRTQSEGVAMHRADSERIDAIADVFPAIFFLVAALVALTTMTRTVEDDRILIGTYKALGYSKGRIAQKYLLYALVAAGIGAVLGIAVLSQVLPLIIISSYSIIYAIPALPLPLPIDAWSALVAGGLGVGITLLATLAAVANSLREAPSTLMLPRAPKAGKRILLERIGPLWRRLSFSRKVTCRNLLRYKRRFLMTVIGISGCTALLLVGFGLHDAIWDIIEQQYGPIIHYDTTVGLAEDASDEDIAAVASYLSDNAQAGFAARVQQINMQAAGTNKARSTAAGATTRVGVIVPQDIDALGKAVTFRDRLSGEALAFGDDSVFLTEKLSSLLGVRAGDTVLLYGQDTVGNATGEPSELVVTGIVENYVGNNVYVGRSAWKSASEGEPLFSTIFATLPSGTNQEALAAALHGQGKVSTVIFSSETINTYRSMLSVVDFVVVVLIVSAAALAYIVLYNLTNINVEERVREIASLKVLGFTKPEVHSYVFREVVLLSVIGDVLGVVLGRLLATFVITTAEVDYVMFGRQIHPQSHAYAFALTLLFTALVLVFMRRKLDRVDMVESLKSVD